MSNTPLITWGLKNNTTLARLWAAAAPEELQPLVNGKTEEMVTAALLMNKSAPCREVYAARKTRKEPVATRGPKARRVRRRRKRAP